MSITALQANQQLSHIHTKEDLVELISTIDASVDGEITLLYSGVTGFIDEANGNEPIGSRDVAQSIRSSNASTRIVNDSEVAKFLSTNPSHPEYNIDLTDKLIDLFGDSPSRPGSTSYQFLYGEVVDGERIANGVWDTVSERFVAEAHGEIRTLSGGADPQRIFAMTEIPAILSNENITHVDGIPIESLREMSADDVLHTIRAQSEGLTSQIMMAVDQAGAPVLADGRYVVDSSFFFSQPGGTHISTATIPDGVTMKSVADFIPQERIRQHATGYAHLRDIQLDVELQLNALSGPEVETLRTPLLKALDQLGTAVEILGVTLVALEAGEAYAAGETHHANQILWDWAIENAGGLIAGRLAALALTPLLAAGSPGILLAAGLTVLASMAGSEYADDLIDWISNALNPWNEDFRRDFNYLYNQIAEPTSPLILDLDGDHVETIGLTAGDTFFDHDANGMAEKTGWVAPDDGLLVFDRNNNGEIENGTELFGDNTILRNGERAANGFEALREFDDNDDGWINSHDPVWENLGIWQDINGNARLDSGELHTLEAAGVGAISTAYVDAFRYSITPPEVNGNAHRLLGSYVTTAAEERDMTDIWFLIDRSRTVDTEAVPVSAEIASFPNLPGMGNMPSLHQAMARDPSGELQTLVARWIDGTASERQALIDPIIFQWAGVEEADPASYGNDPMDARKIAVLEVLRGEEFPNRLNEFFINTEWDRQRAFKLVHQQVEGALIQHSDLASVVSGVTAIYDPQRSAYGLDGAEAVTTIQELAAQGDHQEDFFAMSLALQQLDAESIRKQLMSSLQPVSPVQDWPTTSALFMLGADEWVRGTPDADSLYSQQQKAWLTGGDGDDTIRTGDGEYIIEAGPGIDVIYLGQGTVLHRFSHGDGIDVIYGLQPAEGGGVGRLLFAEDIDPGSIEIGPTWEEGGVTVRIRETEDQIIFPELTLGDPLDDHRPPIQSLHFGSGADWDLTAILERYALGEFPNDTIGEQEITPLQQTQPTPEQVGEYGTVEINHEWTTIALQGSYTEPVVITGDPTLNGGNPVAVRLRNIDSDSFEIRLQEPEYKDGLHRLETVSWLALEAGVHELTDGTLLEAGITSSSLLSPQGFDRVDLAAPFEHAPTLLTQVQTFEESDWVVTRTDAITGRSFDLTMQEEEQRNRGSHLSERIGWLAITPGIGDDGDTLLEAGITDDILHHRPETISFSADFIQGNESRAGGAPPTLLAKLSSFDGADPATLRLSGITGSGFSAVVAEEQSADTELLHTSERGSWLALAGASGTIEALTV